MQICITQRDGIRYFSRFKNIPERDRIEIELTIDDVRPRVFTFDLTEALFEHFAKYPEILGKRAVREDDEEQPKPKGIRKSSIEKKAVVTSAASRRAAKPTGKSAAKAPATAPALDEKPKRNGRKKPTRRVPEKATASALKPKASAVEKSKPRQTKNPRMRLRG